MKVTHLNHSDVAGGAARAAYRLHRALRAVGVDSHMWVNQAGSGDWAVEGPGSKRAKTLALLRPQLGKAAVSTLTTGNRVIHSPAVLPSAWAGRVNSSDAAVVHLHWIQDEMLSIADIARIEKPVVWTLHDMWAFCGAEHYTDDLRWREGYRRDNRPPHEAGFDLNRWTWHRKRKHWRQPVHIVTPSRWLGDCVRQSSLMHDWPVSVVPNCIDTETWAPLQQPLARGLLGLPPDVPLLLFGALGGGKDPRKGFDLLQASLRHLHDAQELRGLELVVFGQSSPRVPSPPGFPVHYVGHLHDELSLRVLYSAADALVIPSRLDNLPNTGVEATACGTPVVAFDTGGLADIVMHRQSGYLAAPFETEDLAQGIAWVLRQRESGLLGARAREFAVARYSPVVVAGQYLAVYASAMAAH